MTPNEAYIQEIGEMGPEDLLNEILNNPDHLTDTYYHDLGKAIIKRAEELLSHAAARNEAAEAHSAVDAPVTRQTTTIVTTTVTRGEITGASIRKAFGLPADADLELDRVTVQIDPDDALTFSFTTTDRAHALQSTIYQHTGEPMCGCPNTRKEEPA